MTHRSHLRTGDQALVREINLSVIMRRLLEHAALSRASLAEVTGLNKSTVSSLVQELIEMGFVHEAGQTSSGVGRPSTLLELNPRAGYIVSCELGVDFISVACANFSGEVFWRLKENTAGIQGQGAIIERTLALLHQAVRVGASDCADCGGLLGIAVGVPGLVEQATGTLLFAPNLGWQDVPVQTILAEKFPNVPLFVDNEANMAALGEYLFGAARGYNEVLYISAGVGVGGAVVRNGQLVRGTTGFAAEFGHMTLDPDGLPCNCGNHGCWETLVSQSAVFRLVREAIGRGRSSRLVEMTGGDLEKLSIPLVVEAANQGDDVALSVFSQVGRYLGIGIASLINAFNPDLIVLGGILSLAGNLLLPAIRAEVAQRALRWNAAATQIELAQHGFDACVMGGVAALLQAIVLEPGKYNLLHRP
ncbi:MAG: ROK family transcriptional regulator [Anaerolineae bacterium]